MTSASPTELTLIPWRVVIWASALQAITDRRGLLEGERLAGDGHLLLQACLDGVASPCEKIMGLVQELGISMGLDPPDAGRRAALDLILKAGPRPVREDAVGAGAEREGTEQRAQRLVHRT